MVIRGAVAAAAGLLAYGAYVMWKRSTQPPGEPSDAITDTIVSGTVRLFRLWRAPEQYAAAISRAEIEHQIPPMMLERLLYQESRYREDIITGKVRSRVGAVGIAQFMPATAADLGIDPLDPNQAIQGAARYLRRLYNRFGNWTEALAAYNWGQGNVARRGLAAAPRETRTYWTQILADVNEISAPVRYA